MKTIKPRSPLKWRDMQGHPQLVGTGEEFYATISYFESRIPSRRGSNWRVAFVDQHQGTSSYLFCDTREEAIRAAEKRYQAKLRDRIKRRMNL